MTTEQLKALIKGKTIIDFETEDQDFEHGLRLVLRDTETGELGILAVEAIELALPSEVALDYSYQVIADREQPEHGYDVLTRVGPDYQRGEVPFLFD